MQSFIESTVKRDIVVKTINEEQRAMDNQNEMKWLVEIFVQYQETIDNQRKVSSQKMWLKEALDVDRKKRQEDNNSASSLDAC